VRATQLIQRIGRTGAGVSIMALLAGLALALGSAAAAGDWWLAQRPWIEVGMRLAAVGLAGSAFFGGLRVAVEPVGWWRLAAVPSGIVIASFWLFALAVGLPTSGPGGGDTDVVAILYSVPQLLALLVLATVEVAAVPIVARYWGDATHVDGVRAERDTTGT
jgi:hypothetical protein